MSHLVKKLFLNHTSENVFQNFEQQFKTILYREYTHLELFHIDCYTIDQYKQLDGVTILEDTKNDTFLYSVDVKIVDEQRIIFAAIIFSPTLCETLNFTEKEKLAAIAHEVGHIIHYFNENLTNANSLMVELKADEVAEKLGLAEPLKTVLEKLKSSKLYSREQSQLMDLRRQFLK